MSSALRTHRFYQALAHRVIDAYGILDDQGDLEELVKIAVARTGARYDSETIRKAVDAALHARRRKTVTHARQTA
jgi:hypothetical protein